MPNGTISPSHSHKAAKVSKTPKVSKDSKDSKVSRRVQEAAEKIERHLQTSRLRPGDRYMPAEEVSQFIGESVMTAQRAMAVLAGRKVLERRPAVGTFVGEAAGVSVSPTSIHYIMPQRFKLDREAKGNYWDQIDGICSVMPNASVHFNFLPENNPSYTQHMVEQLSEAGLLMGVVLVLPSRELRAYFNNSGIPTVVEGGVEPDLTNLCWIDRNQVQMGRLLAEYLIQRGHRRFATIMRDIWSMGEHLLHDGISDALSAEQIPASALRSRSAPSEAKAIQEVIRSLLLDEEHPPTGIICRTVFQADCVAETARSLGLHDQMDIVVCNAPSQPEQSPYTCAISKICGKDVGQMVGSMLQDLSHHKTPQPRGQSLSVELHDVHARS